MNCITNYEPVEFERPFEIIIDDFLIPWWGIMVLNTIAIVLLSFMSKLWDFLIPWGIMILNTIAIVLLSFMSKLWELMVLKTIAMVLLSFMSKLWELMVRNTIAMVWLSLMAKLWEAINVEHLRSLTHAWKRNWRDDQRIGWYWRFGCNAVMELFVGCANSGQHWPFIATRWWIKLIKNINTITNSMIH